MEHIACTVFYLMVAHLVAKVVYTPFKTWIDAQRCFRKHSESNTAIHNKSMHNYQEFLKQVSGKKDPVDMQLGKSTVKQVDKNRKVLLSIIDFCPFKVSCLSTII